MILTPNASSRDAAPTADSSSIEALLGSVNSERFSAFPREIKSDEIKVPTRLSEEEHREQEKMRRRCGPWSRQEWEEYDMNKALKEFKKGKGGQELQVAASSSRAGQGIWEAGSIQSARLRGQVGGQDSSPSAALPAGVSKEPAVVVEASPASDSDSYTSRNELSRTPSPRGMVESDEKAPRGRVAKGYREATPSGMMKFEVRVLRDKTNPQHVAFPPTWPVFMPLRYQYNVKALAAYQRPVLAADLLKSSLRQRQEELESLKAAAESRRRELAMKALAEKSGKTLEDVRKEWKEAPTIPDRPSGSAGAVEARAGGTSSKAPMPQPTAGAGQSTQVKAQPPVGPKARPKAPAPVVKPVLKHKLKNYSLEEWQSQLEFVLKDGGTLKGLGVFLDSRLTSLPTPLGEFAKKVVRHFSTPLNPDERHKLLKEAATLPPTGAEPGEGVGNWPFNYHGDLLPINPVGVTSEYLACSPEVAAWVRLILHQLNFAFCAGERLKDPSEWRRFYTKSQHGCCHMLKRSVLAFFEAGDLRPRVAIEKGLSELRSDYCGEAVVKMHQLSADKVLPCWPKPGYACVQPLTRFCSGETLRHLLDPSLAVKDPTEWPETPRKSRVRASQKEWEALVTAGVKRKIFKEVKKEEIFRDQFGELVLAGAGGVVKVKVIDGEEKELLRFISILCPINDFLNVIPGDDGLLPYAGQITGMVLEETEELILDSEDFESCFNLFELPDAWLGYLAFEKTVDSSIFGGKKGGRSYVAIGSVPMGWNSAVACIQHAVRHLVFDRAGVDPATEVSKAKTMPKGPDRSVVYLDSLDRLRAVEKTLLQIVRGTRSHEVQRFVDECEALGLPLNLGKRLVGAVLGTIQGGEISEGAYGLSLEKALGTTEMSTLLLTSPKWSEKVLRHWAGRACFAAIFRRPLFSLLGDVFFQIGRVMEGPCAPSVASFDEVLAFMVMLPMAKTNLKAELSNEIVVTDASPSGGGAAVATEFKSKALLKDAKTASQRECSVCGSTEGEALSDCPRFCGALQCCTPCALQHYEVCPLPVKNWATFGERYAWGEVPLTEAVRRAGLEIQEPVLLSKCVASFSAEDRKVLHELGSDPNLAMEHWSIETGLWSKARGEPIELRDGRRVDGPHPVRSEAHLMGVPWLSPFMRGRLRRSNALAMKALDAMKTRAGQNRGFCGAHFYNSWFWSIKGCQTLLGLPNVWVATSSFCCHGGKIAKWCSWVTNCPELHSVLDVPHCPGHTDLWEARPYFDGSGVVRIPTEEAQFPPELCAKYADALRRALVRLGSLPRAPQPAVRLEWIKGELAKATKRFQDAEVLEVSAQYILGIEQGMIPGKELEHLRSMLLETSHRGCDVRLRSALKEDEEKKGLSEIPYPAYAWLWKELLSYKWRNEQHINVLEVTAFLVYLRHQARQGCKRSTKWLHVVDSRVTAGVLAKGRSSSHRLNRLCKRIMALSVFGDMYPMVLWTISGWNFADRASRRGAGSSTDG